MWILQIFQKTILRNLKQVFIGGVNLQRSIGNTFFLQSGLWFVRKGYTKDGGLFNTDITINDVELPLLFGAKIGKGKISFLPNLGFSLAFNIGNKYTLTSNSPLVTSSSYNQSESAPAPQRINFYLNMGIKYSLNDNFYLVLTPYYKVDVKNMINPKFNIDATSTLGAHIALWYN